MDINISEHEMRKKKLFIGLPMYGGVCHGSTCKSLMELAASCKGIIDLQPYFLFNESLIPRARNYISDVFLRSDCTHMLFIDSDIGFSAEHVFHMLGLMTEESDYDILCGPYPKKTIAWEKIKFAVDKGIADENPNELENYVGDYVFNPVPTQTGQVKLDEPVEVLESGTGFMMIQKRALLKFADHYKEFSYKPDHVRSADFDGSREIITFFDCIIDPETKRYLSEDYFFCQMARKIGIKVWLAPWITLTHAGTTIYGGSLLHLLSIGASATADEGVVKSKHKK
jgi:hypothetical protein